MLKIILTFITAIFMQPVFAKELMLINNGSSTGINSQLLQEYVKQFSDYKISVTHTNSNCALSKILWNNSNQPTMYVLTTNIDGSSDKNNLLCYMKFNSDNLLFINYSAPVELCSISSKSWEDLIKPNSSHVIGITATTTSLPEQFLTKLSDIYGIKLKYVRINTNAEFMTLAKSQELDFGFRTGLSGLEFFKNKCIWNVSQLDNTSIPNIQSSKMLYDNLYEESVILHKNLSNEQIKNFRDRLHRSWSSLESVSLRQKRGYDDSLVSYKTEEEMITLFNKFLSRF